MISVTSMSIQELKEFLGIQDTITDDMIISKEWLLTSSIDSAWLLIGQSVSIQESLYWLPTLSDDKLCAYCTLVCKIEEENNCDIKDIISDSVELEIMLYALRCMYEEQ